MDTVRSDSILFMTGHIIACCCTCSMNILIACHPAR